MQKHVIFVLLFALVLSGCVVAPGRGYGRPDRGPQHGYNYYPDHHPSRGWNR